MSKSQAKRHAAQKGDKLKAIICVILDRSGSMGGREKDTVNGVNTFLDGQKKLKEPASLAMVRFDTEAIERFRPMADLRLVTPLTLDEYKPRGGTPLLDAVGQTIVQLDKDWTEEKADRAIVVIVTDGEENSSKEYSKEKIKEMITARQNSGKWAFIYLGADVDSFAEAMKYGISVSNTANFKKSLRGMEVMYAATSETVSRMRSTGSTVAHNLGGDLQEDGKLDKSKAPTWQQP